MGLGCLPVCQISPGLVKQDLKTGQKPYFYSIMKIYDSKASREMLYRRYAINLQHQNILGKCQPVQLLASAAQRNWRGAEKSHRLEAIMRHGLWAMKVHQTQSEHTVVYRQSSYSLQPRSFAILSRAVGTTGSEMMWVCCYLCHIHPLHSLSLTPIHRNDANTHRDS